MADGISEPMTRDAIKALMRQFVRDITRETQYPTQDPQRKWDFVPEIATFVKGVVQEEQVTPIEAE